MASFLSTLDVVYFVKDSAFNDELVYSLRSVRKNFPHRSIWLVGGKPKGAVVDRIMPIKQRGATKWERVRNMLISVCQNPDISDDFVLFNDDFFVTKPVETLPPFYDGSLAAYCVRIETNNGFRSTAYTRALKQTIATLEAYGKGTLNYELHVPFVFNKRKLLEVDRRFPETRGVRSLYANWFGVVGVPLKDNKVADTQSLIGRGDPSSPTHTPFISTEDRSFREGRIGEHLRALFSEEC